MTRRLGAVLMLVVAPLASIAIPDEGGEETGRACVARNAESPAMTLDEMACEADEIQFGFRCIGSGATLLTMSVMEIACKADEIQFGFRP